MHHHASASHLRGRLTNAALTMGLALAVVLYLEHLRGVVPCHLCYGERVPYYVGTVLAVLLVPLAGRGPAWVTVLGTACLAGVTAWALALGAHHLGVERGWWPGPTSCSSAAGGLADPRQLLAQLRDIQVTACDKVGFTLLGQSLATWNALLAAGLLAYVASAGINFARDRRTESHVAALGPAARPAA